jgi:hypothetical protein
LANSSSSFSSKGFLKISVFIALATAYETLWQACFKKSGDPLSRPPTIEP